MEAGKTIREAIGGSLPVENVQELASRSLNHIPDRYIRSQLELHDDILAVQQPLQIPIWSCSSVIYYHCEIRFNLSKCKPGVNTQLINHGAAQVIEEMKVVTEEFFKLPLMEKMICGQLPNNIEGYGQAFVVSEDQKLDWGDMLFLMALPHSKRNMTFWPQNPTNFRETLHNYSKELHKIALRLLSWMAKNLGIEAHELSAPYEDCNQGIRMNYYPPCVNADKVVGLTPHSDATGLTLLLQVNQVQGLQIKKDSKWIPIQPIYGAIIVNIGDILEIMSNGEYSSIEHRAVVNFEKERLSIAAFHSPNVTANIGPLPDLVKKSAEKYKTLSHQEYLKQVMATKLDGKSLLEHMKIT
ncbi:hypothetical protein BUALT_Bualt05G0081400 [Buddleja alternifolia]|uniref:Fe2OG dioxygenase domain-containing protein n=1 Tax=Buddleja alternifolia TaxID=168488 RepID=A0AAV6XTN6_9LAMI|nr:hypothetical protein BUALT_Bualt05G0081400 [Buddleja alternifolia]